MTNAPLRIGILGAARIAPTALIRPAARNPEVIVAAVASRDHARADRTTQLGWRRGIPAAR
ncbi:putative dehydrogenase [Nocardia sp. GAS34]